MRGEDATEPSTFLPDEGSPPHARGRLAGVQFNMADPGITPACAGKTLHSWEARRSFENHPRMRGEDRASGSGVATSPGSPPHARGRRAVVVAWSRLPGITPACAGKTPTTRRRSGLRRDHPRMRGEDVGTRRGGPSSSGSPPHARGRLSSRWTIRLLRMDHPRMRGEDLPQLSTGDHPSGSPPHARGRHMYNAPNKVVYRITPACAGKTWWRPVGRRRVGDHPRMRGEDRQVSDLGEPFAGSPPHARGRRFRFPRSRLRGRITPACAGKTTCRPGK